MNKQKQKYIIANWKMNGTRLILEEWINTLFVKAQNNDFDEDSVEVVLCPPAVLIDRAFLIAQTYNAQNDFYLSIGAQNTHQEEMGAYTGDISAKIVKEAGAKFVILGHSERREHHNESSEIISKKVQTAINNGLVPIVCVGEKESTRNLGEERDFVEKQLMESIPENIDAGRVIIAYEPIWSIGTGKTPTINEIEDMINHIKYAVAKNRKISENGVTVLYGGSVKSDNSNEIMSLDDIDGLLVGGASLDPDDFFDIIKSSL